MSQSRDPVYQAFHLRGREALLRKVVFELRYRRGFTYLDKCGRLINQLMELRPEWQPRPQDPNPQAALLVNLDNACTMSVDTRKLVLCMERPVGELALSDEDAQGFVREVDEMTTLVIEFLALQEFERIGFRSWFFFAGESRDDTELYLRRLGCFQLPDSLFSAFQGEPEAASAVAIVRGIDRSYRIAFAGVESPIQLDIGQEILTLPLGSNRPGSRHQRFLQNLEKKRIVRQNSKFAVMIDIDCYRDQPGDVEPADFVTSSLRFLPEALKATIKKEAVS